MAVEREGEREKKRGMREKKREKPPPPLSPGAHFPRVPLLLLLCTYHPHERLLWWWWWSGSLAINGMAASPVLSAASLLSPAFSLYLVVSPSAIAFSFRPSEEVEKLPSPSPFLPLPQMFCFSPPSLFLTYPFRLSSTTTSLLFSASITAFFCANMCPRSFLFPSFFG